MEVLDAAGQGRQGEPSSDLVLQAYRRKAEAEDSYHRALADYNVAIMQLHLRMGSLLEYDGVHLAEGPWPAKAYFDARRRARARDAAYYIDYGFSSRRSPARGRFRRIWRGRRWPPRQADAPDRPTDAARPALEPIPAPEPASSGGGIGARRPAGRRSRPGQGDGYALESCARRETTSEWTVEPERLRPGIAESEQLAGKASDASARPDG